LRALQRQPELRYQQASELKTCVEKISEPVRGQPSVKDKAPPSPWLMGALAMALLAAMAALALAVLHFLPGQQQPAQPNPVDAICQSIQAGVGRDLREAGATYDDLQVTVAEHRDSATPFKVSYSGLRHFTGSNGATPPANGSFIMNYVGSGQWQGTLAGHPFTVLAGSRDNIDLPFVNDPEVIGQWQSIDFVQAIGDFNPARRSMKGDLFLKGVTFLEEGKTSLPWWTWTKGVVIHHGDQTASHYEIRKVDDREYLFLEWKSGDFTILGKRPPYYVLQR
jgi:hypothetical protein